MGGIVSRLRSIRLPSDPFNLAPGIDAILLHESDAFHAAATLTFYHFALPPHHFDSAGGAAGPRAGAGGGGASRDDRSSARESSAPGSGRGATSEGRGGGVLGGDPSGEGRGGDRGSGWRGGNGGGGSGGGGNSSSSSSSSGGGGGGMVWRFQLVDAVQWLHQHVRDAAAAGDIPEDDPLLAFLRRFLPRSPPTRLDINRAFSLLSTTQRRSASHRGLSLALFHTVAAHSLRCAALRRLHTRLLLLVPCAASCSALASLALFSALGITRPRLVERLENPEKLRDMRNLGNQGSVESLGREGSVWGSGVEGVSSSTGWRWPGWSLLQAQPSRDVTPTPHGSSAPHSISQHRSYHVPLSGSPAGGGAAAGAAVGVVGGDGTGGSGVVVRRVRTLELTEPLPRRVVVIPSLLLGAAIGAALALHL
ncbi:unnamed protein product [Closterium sp. NIES-53]